ncbi:MAG: hypothetical protein NTY06_04470, partial [Candidatus Gottesmanbacteria bacterium]|nr:hypothetical protein [Candidatus Gottesmanbacteria bacterium]
NAVISPLGMIEETSRLWEYLTSDMRELVRDGEFLIQDSLHHHDAEPTDFSYIVFPFSKLYEGFLKKLFLDAGIISEREYHSDHFRIGKALSPNMVRQLADRSAYKQISDRYGAELAARLWHTWKEGRNMVFHYFPHNYRSLTRSAAIELVNQLVGSMREAVLILATK